MSCKGANNSLKVLNKDEYSILYDRFTVTTGDIGIKEIFMNAWSPTNEKHLTNLEVGNALPSNTKFLIKKIAFQCFGTTPKLKERMIPETMFRLIHKSANDTLLIELPFWIMNEYNGFSDANNETWGIPTMKNQYSIGGKGILLDNKTRFKGEIEHYVAIPDDGEGVPASFTRYVYLYLIGQMIRSNK